MTPLDPNGIKATGATMSGMGIVRRVPLALAAAIEAVVRVVWTSIERFWNWFAYDLMYRVPGYRRYAAALNNWGYRLEQKLSAGRRAREREENLLLAAKLREAGAPHLAEKLEGLR